MVNAVPSQVVDLAFVKAQRQQQQAVVDSYKHGLEQSNNMYGTPTTTQTTQPTETTPPNETASYQVIMADSQADNHADALVIKKKAVDAARDLRQPDFYTQHIEPSNPNTSGNYVKISI